MRELIIAAVLGFLGTPLAFGDSPFNGTWKADLDKNKSTPKAEVFELLDGVYECRSCSPPERIRADGKDYPIAGSPIYDTLSVTVIDGHAVSEVLKKAGKIIAEVRSTVSADGLTQVVDQKVSLPGAEPMEVKDTLVQVAPGSPGAHAISGTWQKTKTEGSDSVDLTTFKISQNRIDRTDSQGSSYSARLDGSEAFYKGHPLIATVSVRLIDGRTLEQTDKKDGRIVMIERWRIDADGTTMHARFDNTKGSVFEQTGHRVP
jgi:hypothetical protein